MADWLDKARQRHTILPKIHSFLECYMLQIISAINAWFQIALGWTKAWHIASIKMCIYVCTQSMTAHELLIPIIILMSFTLKYKHTMLLSMATITQGNLANILHITKLIHACCISLVACHWATCCTLTTCTGWPVAKGTWQNWKEIYTSFGMRVQCWCNNSENGVVTRKAGRNEEERQSQEKYANALLNE